MAWAPWLLVVAAGFFGAYFIGSRLRGLQALGVFAFWLLLPYPLLWIILALSSDPTLSAEQRANDHGFAFVLGAIAITIPWALLNLVGVAIGRSRRRRTGALPSQPIATPAPDDGLPDWRHADNPSLALEQIDAGMREIAARARIPADWLPRLGMPPGGTGSFLDRDKFDYIHARIEDGRTVFDHRVVIADQLYYDLFKDLALRLAGERADAADPGAVRRAQQAILAGIDPRWGRQFDREPI